ncbi:hypothetical protein EVAR_98996_1 [Eumeta japonica]|uniref:Uncharacterized protein n=1 Tax=Eumeta variegata TaxID=151549 RepID=A0A4C1YRD5_EUMVA|nr:hypothetical protein EVAR_98996_1 [Eumeta japonica]
MLTIATAVSISRCGYTFFRVAPITDRLSVTRDKELRSNNNQSLDLVAEGHRQGECPRVECGAARGFPRAPSGVSCIGLALLQNRIDTWLLSKI